MKKTFCDLCGDIIDGDNAVPDGFDAEKTVKQHKVGIVTLKVRVVAVTVGDFCKYCMIGAVNCADDRPKAVCSSRCSEVPA